MSRSKTSSSTVPIELIMTFGHFRDLPLLVGPSTIRRFYRFREPRKPHGNHASSDVPRSSPPRPTATLGHILEERLNVTQG